ncbi:hypothetical protein CYMTET_55267 [Cymbomonas tetramitiformis]|uniref:Pterin-binding domain-containing protein n=1 Tax=Cymbomonas tetramitiformis TaxID=36881 RepID=A0AAE0BEH1_9CHLO|nr:hypothetical protein CYMTET_55267 [Cymbomonas tetramitiformis]
MLFTRFLARQCLGNLRAARPSKLRLIHASASVSSENQVVIALGSNQGASVSIIKSAVNAMEREGIEIQQHSCLYETAPMHVTDQARYLNAAVKGKTTLSPFSLMKVLQGIQRQHGREEGGQRWGPRPLDLDIIFYGNKELQTEDLQIPHPRAFERPFVLAPLDDLLDDVARPSKTDAGGSSVDGRLSQARQIWISEFGGEALMGTETIKRVVPVAGDLWEVGRRTRMMGILNVTPDSFSDGGRFNNVETAVRQAQSMAADGVDIIDIGGQSTRPGADLLSPEEEVRRVIPVLRALTPIAQDTGIALSVDTFYSAVARDAVEAGAHIVNDVSGGTLDKNMFATVAALKEPVPYVMMHMRGDPKTMQSRENTTYTDVSTDVGAALQTQAEQAVQQGVMPWQLWLDPGIGFAKTHEQNFELLRNLPTVRSQLRSGCLRHAPLLVGPSRKGFLGSLTGRSAEDRDVATMAAVGAGIVSGADVVRVHNAKAGRDTILVADAIWRE